MKGVLKVIFFLPVVFCGPKSFAQDSAKGFSLLLSPALFVPVSVALQGGVQFKAGKRFRVLAEAAFPTFHPNNTAYEKIQYWRAGLEIKFRPRKFVSSKKYFAWQNNFLFRRLTDEGQDFYYTRSQTFSYQNAVIKTPVLSSALKLGVELPAGKKTFIDAFIGAGLRFVFTNYRTEKPLLTSTEPSKTNFLDFDNAWLYNYTLTRFHATAGLRFGFRL